MRYFPISVSLAQGTNRPRETAIRRRIMECRYKPVESISPEAKVKQYNPPRHEGLSTVTADMRRSMFFVVFFRNAAGDRQSAPFVSNNEEEEKEEEEVKPVSRNSRGVCQVLVLVISAEVNAVLLSTVTLIALSVSKFTASVLRQIACTVSRRGRNKSSREKWGC